MRVALFVLCALFSMFGTANAARVFDVLPQTGQTKCYDSVGSLIDCVGTGQDGELKKGIPWPDPRFVDHGNGTITDMLTGLMWLKDADCAYTIGYNPDGNDPIIGAMSWFNAIDFVKKMNARTIDACGSYAAGHTDWRLPTPRELESLINYGANNNFAWLTNRGFLNVKAKEIGCFDVWSACSYWTSTTQVGISGYALAVELETLVIYSRNKNFDNSNPVLVWPVRADSTVVNPPAPVIASGQIECYDAANTTIPCSGTGQDGETQAGKHWSAQRFIDNGDETITDTFTNLMWLKSSPYNGGTWKFALDYAKGMNTGLNEGLGYTDWYIPNAHEALSLVSWHANPALPQGHSFNLYWDNSHWTSSYAFNYGSKDSAVVASFSYGGNASSNNKTAGADYLPVRSLMFRNAVGNFYQSSGRYQTGQCVPYVRYETWLPKEKFYGRAYKFFEQAQAAGYYTGSVPRVGSVIVFAIDDSKGIPDGHVAIVTAVDGNNVTMQDQNWVKPLKIGVHTENVSQYNILGYIYP